VNLKYITAAAAQMHTIGQLYKCLHQFYKGSRMIVAGILPHVCDPIKTETSHAVYAAASDQFQAKGQR
jgi:hypothetical protein